MSRDDFTRYRSVVSQSVLDGLTIHPHVVNFLYFKKL